MIDSNSIYDLFQVHAFAPDGMILVLPEFYTRWEARKVSEALEYVGLEVPHGLRRVFVEPGDIRFTA